MTIYRFVVRFKRPDPRSAGYLADAHALGFTHLTHLECQDLYFIEGRLSPQEAQQLAIKLLSDPVVQKAAWEADEEADAKTDGETDGETEVKADGGKTGTAVVEVTYRPGVTDPVAQEIVRAAHELGFDGVQRAATGLRFLLRWNTSPDNLSSSFSIERLAKQLLANHVIQHWAIGKIAPSFPEQAESSGQVEVIPLRSLSDAELLNISAQRRAALDLAEMQAIQAYYRRIERDPTDVEFETIAQTWSEHCVHKTFKARVDVRYSILDTGYAILDDSNTRTSNTRISNTRTSNTRTSNNELSTPETVDSIIKTYLKAATDKISAPWVLSAFVDNAGIIAFDDEFEVSFKVETHNHPSAIEPFGGANTGVGGVIRDILGVSAKPIAATDVLCFGPQEMPPDALPEGVLHPRRIQSGVVAGVQDYGNKIGIPTVNGAILYDEGYIANPLVFCGCVGIAPRGRHRKNPQIGDRVIVLGGRTGRDGLRGATFSSMTMDAQTGEVAGASVQIGDPITEKGLIDVITRARDLGLYHDITDCGAGGLSSAVGEMAARLGADVELQNVRLKYPGLAPWEIWLSEAQERMVLAVPPDNLPVLQALCDTFNTELTDIGAFTGNGKLIVRYGGKIVLELENEFLHKGIPQRHLEALIVQSKFENSLFENSLFDHSLSEASNIEYRPTNNQVRARLLALLAHPNIASKAATIRLYDHEVQGGTAVKPLVGVQADAPSDAAVLKPIGTRGTRGIVLSNGINPEYGKRDPYRMALSVIDEAIRNAVAVGADPQRIALLDNFCWGDPKRPETMGTLIEAARGCYDGALLFGTPFISGKDSLNNEYLGADGQRHAIPPTLLISAIGIIDDVHQAVTMDLKTPGNALYLVGELPAAPQPVPEVPAHAPALYRALHQAMLRGLVKSCHDVSEGGLAVAAAEMCIGGRLGLVLADWLSPKACFAETNSCLLAEVSPEAEADFRALFADLPLARIGTVAAEPVLKIAGEQIPVADLVKAFTGQN